MLYQGYFNKGASLSVNLAAWDSSREGFIFMSAFGYSTVVKTALLELKKKCSIGLDYKYFTVYPDVIEIYSNKVPESDYSHLIVSRKDILDTATGEEHIRFYTFLQDPAAGSYSLWSMYENNGFPQAFKDQVYDKLYKMSPAPILKDWIPYLLRYFITEGFITEASTINSEGIDPLFCTSLDISVNDLIYRIKYGLQNGLISINNTNTASPFMEEVQGIDSYLHEFSETFTEKIQDSFVPLFIPNQDKYSKDLQIVSDYMQWSDDISLYHAQKDIAQAVSNAFNSGKKNCFIVGEMGSGKTTISIAAINTHHAMYEREAHRDYLTNIVMCPSHLVHMWKREIEDRSPRSEAVIITDFSHLMSLVNKIKGKKEKHLWLIISKDIAKLGYAEQPTAVWRKRPTPFGYPGVFTCPKCGKALSYKTFEGRGRRSVVKHYLTETDFRVPSKTKNNLVCDNPVQVWNPKDSKWEFVLCGEKLWAPVQKDISGIQKNPWVKLGKQGWVRREHLETIKNQIMAKDTQTADDIALLAAVNDELSGAGSPQIAPRKYPLAKYIRKYLKGYIDYCLLDEVHTLKGKDSLQGEAAGDLIYTAKHTVALTGTLLNGYASGIYYLLYRMFTKQMLKEDYEFKNSANFVKDYGVTRKSQWYETERGGRLGDSKGAAQTKELPGVSPVVFTKFLLENTAFISLEDIAEALPSYEEILIGLDMPQDLHNAYSILKNQAREVLSGSKRAHKVAGSIVTLLSVFPDQPYDQPDIWDPETGDILISPPELSEAPRDKENALLSIIQDKAAAGEKVLVYYTWNNRTDLATRLPALIRSHGISCAVLDVSVKPTERESWINKQAASGTQVIFCNPQLVETGLTLLDFTTIIYYQTTYNLYTLRQASRRSWRINQDHDVQVYFLYYKGTMQEQALSLMATKLQAAMTVEGKFTSEGLNAMSNNEDILTQLASSITEDIKENLDVQVFEKNKIVNHKDIVRVRKQRTKNQSDISVPYLSEATTYDLKGYGAGFTRTLAKDILLS